MLLFLGRAFCVDDNLAASWSFALSLSIWLSLYYYLTTSFCTISSAFKSGNSRRSASASFHYCVIAILSGDFSTLLYKYLAIVQVSTKNLVNISHVVVVGCRCAVQCAKCGQNKIKNWKDALRKGIEPLTSRLTVSRSTYWANREAWWKRRS